MVVKFYLFALLCFTSTVFAEDLGSFGPTYPIKERSLKEVLVEKLSQITPAQKAKMDAFFISTFEEKMKMPTPVNLPKFSSSQTRLFDPTVVLNENIKDHKGNIVIHSGARVNPLSYAKLDKDLLFYDATDREQLDWAEKQKITGIHILIKGNPIELSEKWQQNIYFDQGGRLAERFKLKGVPTKISQSGKMLKIDECAL